MKILVAKILKAQGIKGEVKMASSIGDASVFLDMEYMYVGDVKAEVKTVRVDGDFVYVLFDFVKDRNMAEELRGKSVFVDKQQIELSDDDYFVNDLIGCTVSFEDGTQLGELVDIIQNGKTADVYVVSVGEKQVMFPFLKDLKVSVNVDEGKIVLNKKRFDEVSLYED